MFGQQDSASWAAAVGMWSFVGVLLALSGLLVIVIAARAADGRLGRNAWAGVRTRTTRSSDEAWLAAHQQAERLTKAGGVGMIVTAVLPPFVAAILADGDPDHAMGWWSGLMLAGTGLAVALIVRGAVRGQKAARQVVAS